MDKSDLEVAKKRLKEQKLTLSIVKNGKPIFESSSYGISSFLEAMDKLGGKLRGCSIADKIVGKAIALLCVSAKIKAVYAIILSEKARSTLQKYSVHCEWETLVEKILAPNKIDICPFEKLADELTNPSEAYVRFKFPRCKLEQLGRSNE